MTQAIVGAPRRLSEREAAQFLGQVNVRTLQNWRLRGTGPTYIKLGKRVAYDLRDLEAFVDAGRVEPKATFA
jgi:hypothetical protein